MTFKGAKRVYEPHQDSILRTEYEKWLIGVILDLAEQGIAIEAEKERLEAKNADLKRQLRDALERC